MLHKLSSYKTAKSARRIGRGPGSTKGKTSGRGHKGYKARSGSGLRPGFEGGQMALIARIPKVRGAAVITDRSYVPFNLDRLEKMAKNGKITIEALIQDKIIKKSDRIKILGSGEVRSALSVEAHAVSAHAQQKIEKSGGAITIVAHPKFTKKPQANKNRGSK